MKKLVVYYSKTGNTKKIAREIAKHTKADIEEIIDQKERRGILNWLIAGRDGMKKKLTKIKYSKDPSKYDLIILGTPVWGWNMAPSIRTYFSENKGKIKRVAFFCTSGGTNITQTFSDMESASKKPIAKLSIVQQYVKSNNYSDQLNEFCGKLK